MNLQPIRRDRSMKSSSSSEYVVCEPVGFLSATFIREHRAFSGSLVVPTALFFELLAAFVLAFMYLFYDAPFTFLLQDIAFGLFLLTYLGAAIWSAHAYTAGAGKWNYIFDAVLTLFFAASAVGFGVAYHDTSIDRRIKDGFACAFLVLMSIVALIWAVRMRALADKTHTCRAIPLPAAAAATEAEQPLQPGSSSKSRDKTVVFDIE